jgi:hypothetical protein
MDRRLDLVLNDSMSPWLIALVVGLITLNVVMCLQVIVNPEAAASAFDGQGNRLTEMLYCSALAFGRYDCEPDLASGTPFPALVRNCRRRAIGRLQLFFAGLVVLVFVSIITGHVPAFTSHI